MIRVENITKSFDGVEVLKGINFSFYTGKTNLIIGTSGTGKSVLLKCIVGLIDPNEGEVLYDNRNFTHGDKQLQTEIRREIGMLFQGSALFDSMTVEENIMFPLTMFTKMTKEEKLSRVNFCLDRVNLNDKNHLFPSECSGGMQKRIAIARAIAMNPKYLFCDEPNSGLDPKTAIVIDNLIREITYEYNITTVVVTHDMNSVMEIGDSIIFIHKGYNHWQGDKNSILTTDNEEINSFVYASDFMREIRDNLRQKY